MKQSVLHFAVLGLLSWFSLIPWGASQATASSLEITATSQFLAQLVDPSLAKVLGLQKPQDRFCRPVCDYTYPIVTPDYVGLGATCQDAQASLDAQVSSYANNFCGTDGSCGVYTVITRNCFYNSNARQYQMNGYGTFSCRGCA